MKDKENNEVAEIVITLLTFSICNTPFWILISSVVNAVSEDCPLPANMFILQTCISPAPLISNCLDPRLFSYSESCTSARSLTVNVPVETEKRANPAASNSDCTVVVESLWSYIVKAFVPQSTLFVSLIVSENTSTLVTKSGISCVKQWPMVLQG